MRIASLVALVLGVGLGACFSEDGGFICNPGEGGCECNEGVCLPGLECTTGFCTRIGCEPGSDLCVCDDGTCDGELDCFEGIVCRSKKGKGDPTGAGDTDASAGSGEATSVTATAANDEHGTDSAQSDAGEGGCEPACGECLACNPSGECVPDPGTPCSGPSLRCADYVYGLEDGTCYALADDEVSAACNSQGACVAATVQDCAQTRGRAIATCDADCVKAPALCAPFAAARSLVLEAFCEQDGTTTDCDVACFNGSYSQVNVRACSGGTCVLVDEIECDGYDCVGGSCLTSCTSHLDCAMFYSCDFASETCYLP